MASLYEISIGDDIELKRILAAAGLSREDVELLKEHPDRAKSMVQSMRAKAPCMISFDPFVRRDQQIRNMHAWNRTFDLGFVSDHISDAYDLAPPWPTVALQALVLIPYLRDAWSTFSVLWNIVCSRFVGHWSAAPFSNPNQENLRLTKGAKHPGMSLRWEVIDFGANRNRSANEVAQQDRDAHAGILAAAAHHPGWIMATGSGSVPTVALPGYEVNFGFAGKNEWNICPSLEFRKDDHEVALCGHERYSPFKHVAIPTVLSRTKVI